MAKGVQVEIIGALSLFVHPEPLRMLRKESARKKRGEEKPARLDFHPAFLQLRQELRAKNDVPVPGGPRVVKCQAIQPDLRAKVDPIHQ